MPTVMTLGGIVLAILGLLIAFAGLPDRSAGLGLGSDLIQAGAMIFSGGLVVAALGQVLSGLRSMGDRIEDAVYDLAPPRASLNDDLAEATPRPLPRAATARAPIAPAAPEPAEEEEPAAPPARETRAPRPAAREAQPQPRAARPAPDATRPMPPRTPVRPEVRRPEPETRRPEPELEAQRDEDTADDFQPQRSEPRWLRAQADAGNRQPQGQGATPLSNRPSRATPVVNPSRRDPSSAPAAPMPDVRRRPAPMAMAEPEPAPAEQPEASVVRSGIIAGMAYTLYSDGSIEAELPAGLVRFGSLGELQDHVKRAGADDQDGPNAAQR
jgi:hypothetical protein